MILKALRCLAVISVAATTCLAQSDQGNQNTTGVGTRISGTVTVDGKPAAGVQLIGYPLQNQQQTTSSNSDQVVLRATTGSDGHYAFNAVSAGSYIINLFAPVLATAPTADSVASREISVDEGESVEGLDFSMSRGAIITGRVTHPDGRPAIQVPVAVRPVDESGEPGKMTTEMETSLPETDDRGIYRIYGLSAGRYQVFAQTHESAASPYLKNVFYSGSDKSGPATITVPSGEEIENIDITLDNQQPGYQLTGQAVDDAGNPIAGAAYFRSKLPYDGPEWFDARWLVAANGSPDQTDQNGRFRVEGLVNGRYQVSLVLDSNSGQYSDPAQFEIKDQNVSGLQIHVHTGAGLSGVAVLEGDQNPQMLSQLSDVTLLIAPSGGNPGNPDQDKSVTLAPDGSFQVSGVAPGTVNISLVPWSVPTGLALLRIERDGVPQPNGITLSAGEQVTGLRVVLGYATAIR